jgi:RNA polymerase sigma-70 factor, ECF subfamily
MGADPVLARTGARDSRSSAGPLAPEHAAAAVPRQSVTNQSRIGAVVQAHFDFIWRVLRRLGVPEPSVDDAAQKVFLIAAKKIEPVAPAREKSFLFAIALRVAAEERRARRRRRDVCTVDSCAELADQGPSLEELLDRSRARVVMDEILDRLPLEQRVVFVLFEMEEMSMSQIAEFLRIPMGTVASRLRRSRELFQEGVNRFRAKNGRVGAT